MNLYQNREKMGIKMNQRVEFKVPVVVVFGGKPEIRWENRFLEIRQ